MERPNAKGANNFVVGLFVFVSLLVGAGFIVFMGGSTSIGGEVRFKTFFTDVRGLNIGAPVYLSGIQVGRVTDFEFPTEEIKQKAGFDTGIVAVLSIYKQHRDRVKQDSESNITTMGMLGDKVVVVSAGTPSLPALEPSEMMKARQAKDLGDYFLKGGNLVDNLNQTAIGLNEVLAQLNEQGRVSAILANLERITKQLDKTTQNLNNPNSTLGGLIKGGPEDDLGPALKSLRRIVEKIDKGQGTLGALVNDTSLHEDMRILLGGAKRSQAVRFLLRQAISSSEEKEATPKKK